MFPWTLTPTQACEDERKIVQKQGACGRDSRTDNSNGTSLLQYTGDERLAPVNTFFPPPGDAYRVRLTMLRIVWQTKKSVDYILTRKDHRRLSRNVNVHVQQAKSPDSDHNIACASVRILGRSTDNKPRRNPIARKSIDGGKIIPDTDGREQLTAHQRAQIRTTWRHS